MPESVQSSPALRYLPLIPVGTRAAPRPIADQSTAGPDRLGLSTAAKTGSATNVPDPNLQATLLSAARQRGLADAGVVFIDLTRGREASLNAGQAFGSASVIKVPVMAEVFHQVQHGRIRLDEFVTVRRENQTDTWQPEGDRRPTLRSGRQATIRQLVELMITRSDNVATNTLIDVVGRQNLNAYMRGLGFGTTQFHHKLSGGAIPVRDTGYDGGRNQTTARDMARLLALIAQGRLVNPAASRAMQQILGGQMDNDKIPARLPKGAVVYHKTGETSRVTHDVAIVETGGRSYVLAILTNRPPGPDTYRRIAGLARDVISPQSSVLSP